MEGAEKTPRPNRVHLGAKRYWLIWLAVSPLAAWAVVRVLGLDGATPLAPLMAFTPWVAIAALVVGVAALALKNWAAAIAVAGSVALFGAALLPRGFGGGEAAPEGARTLTVVSANVYRGRADPGALAELVNRIHPDVLAIQELRPGYVLRLQEAGIGRLLPHAEVLVHARDVPGGRPGVGLYSKLPIRPIKHGVRSSILSVELKLPGGAALRLATVHPVTPSLDHVEKWAKALRRLPSAGDGSPWLIAGDFNATLDQAELRDVVDRGYRDAGEVTGSGLEMTWPNDRWMPPVVAIDHVLADERLGIAGYGVEDLAGSDHRAIWAEVFLPR